jgi:hypothetical protein
LRRCCAREQVLEKEILPGASAKSSADDLLRFQSDADVAIQIEQALAWLRENQIAVPQPAEVADLLNKLRAWRNSCDYEDTLDGLQLIVKGAIQATREVIVQLDQRNSH